MNRFATRHSPPHGTVRSPAHPTWHHVLLALRLTLLAAGLLLALVACQPSKGGTPPGFTLSLAPAMLEAVAGSGGTFTVTVTIARSAFTGEVTLSLAGTGASGSFSPAVTGGGSSTLTLMVDPSAAPGSYPLTVTGTSGALVESATLMLTVVAPPTLTVAGKVMDMAGRPLSGVTVRVTDGAGPKPLVVTDVEGGFSVAGVEPPYSVSAVPAPPASFDLLPTSWDGVTRSDPQLVLPGLFGVTPACTRAPATILGSLSPAVGAGNTARITFVAEGIRLAPLASSANASLAALDATYSLTVPFDEVLCQTTTTGKLIYLEYDGGGSIVRSAIYDVSVTTGNTTVQNVVSTSATTGTLSGTVIFPSGVASAKVHVALRVNGAYRVLGDTTVTPAAPGYSLAVPQLAGAEYRTLALAGSGGTYQWVYSEVLPAGGSADLVLPNLNTAVAPSGAAASATPTFEQAPVTGADLYLSHVQDAGPTTTTLWLGASGAPSITMPDLPAPARLKPGGSYQWYAVNALDFRGDPSVDDLLDGRLVKTNPLVYGALYDPERIAAGTFNDTATSFTVP